MLLNATRRSLAESEVTEDETEKKPSRWRAWRRQRPFVGGVLVIVAGLVMFLSSQLDFGKLHIQLGIEGLQATIVPLALVLLGALSIFMPAHRIFYGVITLGLAVYSIVGVNLGGFIVGMLLGCAGGITVVSWAPRSGEAASALASGEEQGVRADGEKETA
ncbi:DUF6114 domain-containing protein [Microbacterium sp. CIAB417]|uniref:DUF6114 domain-containing protein n=1 Tax=Microbacterium sp. CIAB417 TaxID=2860287 RepID=UPI001FAE0342|nr:DUF6114 domain-containing protein [Microbacterium sp. CIAB417]